jgi:hypothetical protein
VPIVKQTEIKLMKVDQHSKNMMNEQLQHAEEPKLEKPRLSEDDCRFTFPFDTPIYRTNVKAITTFSFCSSSCPSSQALSSGCIGSNLLFHPLVFLFFLFFSVNRGLVITEWKQEMMCFILSAYNCCEWEFHVKTVFLQF